MNSRNVLWCAVLAGAMAFGIANGTLVSTAEAASAYAARERVVDYSDLNLADSRGIARLHARIHRAAVGVCGSPEGYYLRIKQLRRDCIKSTVEAAVRQVDHPGLRAYHQSRGAPRYALLGG